MKRTIGIDNIFAAYAIAKPAFPPELPTNLKPKQIHVDPPQYKIVTIFKKIFFEYQKHFRYKQIQFLIKFKKMKLNL